jgi:hypothetical protein
MKRALLSIFAVVLALSFSGLSEQVLDRGKFFFQLQEDAGNEEFTFTQLDDGNLRLTSQFIALSEDLVQSFGTDKLFTQEVVLTPQLDLISYRVDSDTEQGRFHVQVTVQNSIAKIQFEFQAPEKQPERQEREIILEDNVITTGIAASQFYLLQKYIDARIDFQRTPEVTLLAFNPVDIQEPLVELTLRRLDPVTLRDKASSQQLPVRRVEIHQVDFRAELLSCAQPSAQGPCTEAGRFLGFVSSTATLAGVRLQDSLDPEGVLVTSVAPGSFAAQAGLQVGDVITRVNGERVINRFQFRELIRFRNPAEPVTLGIERSGVPREIQVRLSGSLLIVYREDLFPQGFEILGAS